MFSTICRSRLSLGLLAALVLACASASRLIAQTPEASLFRIFLTDGNSLVSYGEFARVGDRVVFSVPLGPPGDEMKLQLVSIPDTSVNWPRTDEYAVAVRAKRYAETRGEQDFALLAGRVTQALNEIHLTTDPKRRVAMAEEARRNLAAWPASNFGYRAADVAQLVATLDDVVAEMRVAAGLNQFDLSLVATAAPLPPVDLLPPPDVRASLEAGFRAAVAAEPSERIALLRTLAQELAFAPSSELWAPELRKRATEALAAELRIDAAYATLVRTTLRTAATRALNADVRGLQGVIAAALAADDRLGRKRSGEMAGLLAALDLRLDEARRVRLALDSWAMRAQAFREYRTATAVPRGRLNGFRTHLRDIRDLSGPAVSVLHPIDIHSTMALHELAKVNVPEDLRGTHGLFVASLQMTRQAASLRRHAVSSKDIKFAWDASSAAAGALLLAERAASELNRFISESATSSR